jgi:hypothetical protein
LDGERRTHPCTLDSGNPCRKDVVAETSFKIRNFNADLICYSSVIKTACIHSSTLGFVYERMSRMFKVVKWIAVSMLFVPVAVADGHGHGHHKHHGHHHGHDHYVEVERVYYPERVVQYVPAPAPAPRYQSYDQRSTQGLVGGVLGSAVGYEMSKGDPLGAGIGAAAGAWMGNGMSR